MACGRLGGGVGARLGEQNEEHQHQHQQQEPWMEGLLSPLTERGDVRADGVPLAVRSGA